MTITLVYFHTSTLFRHLESCFLTSKMLKKKKVNVGSSKADRPTSQHKVTKWDRNWRIMIKIIFKVHKILELAKTKKNLNWQFSTPNSSKMQQTRSVTDRPTDRPKDRETDQKSDLNSHVHVTKNSKKVGRLYFNKEQVWQSSEIA